MKCSRIDIKIVDFVLLRERSCYLNQGPNTTLAVVHSFVFIQLQDNENPNLVSE